MSESPDAKAPISVVLINGARTGDIIPVIKKGDIVLASPQDQDIVTLSRIRRAAKRVRERKVTNAVDVRTV